MSRVTFAPGVAGLYCLAVGPARRFTVALPRAVSANASSGRRPLVALSSLAVLAVYSAGYVRTEAAARELDAAAERTARRVPEQAIAVTTPSPLDVVRDTIARRDTPPAAVVVAPAKPAGAERPTAAAAAAEPAPAPVAAAPAPVPAPADSSPRPAVPTIPEYTPPTPPTPPAPPPPSAAQTTDSVATPKVPRPLRDGTFHGYGSSRHGDIEVRIEVAGGKVVYAEISRCLTRWPCNIIERLPGQVVERQTADVDIITGATASSDAFYMAVLDAFSTSRGK